MTYNKEYSKIFQDKDLRIAKLSVATNRINIIAALIKAKPELAIDEIILIVNQLMAENYQDQTLEDALSWIYQGLPNKVEEAITQPKPISVIEARYEELYQLGKNRTTEEEKEFNKLFGELNQQPF